MATEITEFEQEVFEFLDELRESGVTNMFGARPYVMREFMMSGREEEKEAGRLVTKWMATFGERHPR